MNKRFAILKDRQQIYGSIGKLVDGTNELMQCYNDEGVDRQITVQHQGSNVPE